MSKKTKVYFVVVTYNNKDLVDECIQSIQKQTYSDTEIILFDNGSSDGTLDYVKNNYPSVIAVDGKNNLGFAAANNRGIDRALQDEECGYVALVNSDATLDKNWTKILVEFSKEHPNYACLQSPTLDYYDHSILDSRGIKVDRKGRAVQLGHREKYSERPSHIVFGVNAAACILSVDFLSSQSFKNEYFDEDMWMYLEDVDLAARATITGWENWYVNGTFAYHMGSASSGKNPGFSIFYAYRNNLSMLIKNFPTSILTRAVFGAITTDFRTLFSLLRTHNTIPAKAIVKGRLASLKMITIFTRKRHAVRKNSKITKRSLLRLMDAS